MRKSIILFLIFGCNGFTHADIYKRIVGSNGIVTYTNKAPMGLNKPLPVIQSNTRSTSATTGYFYKYQDGAKNVIYTDKPRSDAILLTKTKVNLPPSTPQFAFSSPYVPTMSSFYNNPNKNRFNSIIEQAAARHQVDAKLVHAVIQTESAYRPDAVSSAGAVGLMQLMPATASRFGVLDSNNPEQNINGGTRYLRHLLDLFPNSLHLAIAAYNAGENSVVKYNYNIPPYPETQNYVKQVLALYHQKS